MKHRCQETLVVLDSINPIQMNGSYQFELRILFHSDTDVFVKRVDTKCFLYHFFAFEQSHDFSSLSIPGSKL